MNSMEQKMWDRLLEEKAELVAEVKQLRDRIERAISTLCSQFNDLEDSPDYHRELLSLYSQMICHAVDVLEGKE